MASQPTDLKVIIVDQLDPRLGRQAVHDSRSRGFAFPVTVDKSTWRSKTIPIYDPVPNPEQTVGNCTGCQKAMAFNARGARRKGVVHTMKDANRIYSLATQLDPWPGQWNEDGSGEDTGSSGLAAAKAAQQLGYGGEYRWLFGGIDEVVQAIMGDATVGVGTWWYSNMFHQDTRGRIEPGGRKAGGHEYEYRGFDLKMDELIGRCWWGDDFKDFRVKRTHAGELLDDDGDANVQAGV
jgi:hypothetical protein